MVVPEERELLLQRAARALARTYKHSGGRISVVVERILRHPALYARLDAPDMVKCPLVYVAGALRLAGIGVTIEDYSWLLDNMGQVPFDPPSVAGWDWGPAWLTSQSAKAGVSFANALLAWSDHPPLEVPKGSGDVTLAPDAQLERALDALGRPWISEATRRALTDMATSYVANLKSWERDDRADMLQRALRHLILSGPDAHLH